MPMHIYESRGACISTTGYVVLMQVNMSAQLPHVVQYYTVHVLYSAVQNSTIQCSTQLGTQARASL